MKPWRSATPFPFSQALQAALTEQSRTNRKTAEQIDAAEPTNRWEGGG
jgi:hypothetical protein